ncbi:hypothetical protein CCACVL1_28826 [Corchorus capsularis]|uniref:Uncharacterized protein n=1 Tax=Corchorus capsularis TaxID=210143 RepID=A0A1R3G517_COCAP|nr:hypothetical protein CCACVL1_28826 [Corchorus capsularis]
MSYAVIITGTAPRDLSLRGQWTQQLAVSIWNNNTAGLLLSVTEVGQIRVSAGESVDQKDLCIKLLRSHYIE